MLQRFFKNKNIIMIQTMRLDQQCRRDGGESVHFESAGKKERKEVRKEKQDKSPSPLTGYGISEPDMLRFQVSGAGCDDGK